MKPRKENAMLIDVQYTEGNRRKNEKDYLYIIWKDLDTGEKHVISQPEPTCEIYFTKADCRNHDYNKNYEFLDKLDKKTVRYKNIPFEIAKDMGDEGKRILNNIFTTKQYGKLKEFQLYPYVYGSDLDIRAIYRYKWNKTMNNERVKVLDKGFLDIEVDGLLHDGFPTAETCPINAVTIIDGTHKKSYTFAYIGRKYQNRDTSNMSKTELIKEMKYRKLFEMQKKSIEYLKTHLDEFKQDLNDSFDGIYGHIDYNLYLYEDESKMLVHLWQLINKLKMDIIGIWNMPFDIPYIRDRIAALGLDPAEVMCPKEFPVKEARFIKDNRNFAIKNKTDHFQYMGWTRFICQMTTYAALRKGQQELRSTTLNYIADKELKDKKVDYKEDGGSLKYFPYINFLLFLKYNIKDVLLQYGIEEKVNDFDDLYITSYENNAPYEAAFKQTVLLRDVQYQSFMEQGLVTGNNINIFNLEKKKDDDSENDGENDDDSSYEGALVANPLFNGMYGMPLYGKNTNNIFIFCIDMDMGAFYPNSIIGANIDPSTLIFKVIVFRGSIETGEFKIKEFIHPNEKRIADPKKREKREESDDVAKDIFDNLQTKNYMSMGYKWMNLPDVNDVYMHLKKKLK